MPAIQAAVAIRHVNIKKDAMPLQIVDRQSTKVPWNAGKFRELNRHANTEILVAEYEGKIVGYVVCVLFERCMQIVRIGVRRKMRRGGIGSTLVEKVATNLASYRTKKLACEVDEYDLSSQLFLKRNGFQCISTLRRRGEKGTDIYRFVREIAPAFIREEVDE